MPITIKQAKTEKEFEAYYDLRWRILRQPWQQPKGSEKDELENESFHLMACDERNKVIAVGRLHFNSETEAQIRYMATELKYENRGIGRKIVAGLEKYARKNQRTIITLDAREPAVGFYEKLGYLKKEKKHLLFMSIQHYKMLKHIN